MNRARSDHWGSPTCCDIIAAHAFDDEGRRIWRCRVNPDHVLGYRRSRHDTMRGTRPRGELEPSAPRQGRVYAHPYPPVSTHTRALTGDA